MGKSSFFLVIVIHKPPDPFPKSGTVFCRKWINIILFQCSPKPFDIDVIRCPATTIPADVAIDREYLEKRIQSNSRITGL